MIEIINPQKKQDYMMPTKVYFGRGALSLLVKLIQESTFSKIVLVAGSHFYESVEYQKLKGALIATGKIDFYPEKIKKSTFNSVDNLVKFVQNGGYDGVIGIGGGAVLDSAKIAVVLAKNGGVVEDYLVQKNRDLKNRGLFFIAIPTTSGTGSEVSPWAVVWGKIKYSLSSPEFMFPDIAIIDPHLTDSCPQDVTATSGIDALCQSIECFWNINHNSISDKYALESITTILGYLEKAVNNPDENARDKMAWGSLNSGLGFSNNGTTICHSVSYPMTARWNITHGQAVAITLPMFIEYILPVLEGKRRESIFMAMGVKNEKEAASKVLNLIHSIGLKTKLSELGIPKNGVDLIVDEGFDPTRAKNSPKVPSPQELKEMLDSIF